MSKHYYRGSMQLVVVLLVALCASAQVPSLINYQGRLLNGTNVVNGNVGLSLRLFDAATLGTKLYEDSNTVAVADGLYSTFLGDSTTSGSLSAPLTNAQVWLEAAVDYAAMKPRGLRLHARNCWQEWAGEADAKILWLRRQRQCLNAIRTRIAAG